jgi:hypothetical protein
MRNRILDWDEVRKTWPKKFKDESFIFQEINPGDRIFIGTGCGRASASRRNAVKLHQERP